MLFQFIKRLRFSLILMLVGFFLGSCQNLMEADATKFSVKYLIDREQSLEPAQLLQRLDSLSNWDRTSFNKMSKKHGNVWFHLDLPASEIPRVLEFQTLNLIEFQAFLIKEDG